MAIWTPSGVRDPSGTLRNPPGPPQGAPRGLPERGFYINPSRRGPVPGRGGLSRLLGGQSGVPVLRWGYPPVRGRGRSPLEHRAACSGRGCPEGRVSR